MTDHHLVDDALTYSAPDLVRLTDLSYRQVDYWCRIGLLVPFIEAQGSGTQRRFDEQELRIAAICGVLSELGCPLHSTAARVASTLRVQSVPESGSLFVTTDGEITRAPHGAGWWVDVDELGFDREPEEVVVRAPFRPRVDA